MTTQLFRPIAGSAVVLYHKGLYKQVEVAERGNELYAKIGGGYAAMMHSGRTSYGDYAWSDLSLPGGWPVIEGKVGRVTLKTAELRDA